MQYSSDLFQRTVQRVADAQRIEVENRVLKSGLQLTDDQLERARALADLAIKSGMPDRFLSAVTEITRKPLFIPCSCWWCRLRRWMRRMVEK
jgi:hypothetical protein